MINDDYLRPKPLKLSAEDGMSSITIEIPEDSTITDFMGALLKLALMMGYHPDSIRDEILERAEEAS